MTTAAGAAPSLDAPREPHLRRPLATCALFAALILIFLLARFPAILNADSVDSDSSLIALQARHMLRGEWSWTMWGVPYHSSFESAITAAAFAIFGDSPWVLTSVALSGAIVLIALQFDLLRRRLPLAAATVCVLPLLFTPPPVTWTTTTPPRQWSLTLVFAGIWLLDLATRRTRLFTTIAATIAGLAAIAAAPFIDLYTLALIPAAAAFAAGCAYNHRPATPRQWRTTTLRAFVALMVPLAAAYYARARISTLDAQTSTIATPPAAQISTAAITRNARLLWERCLPWVLSRTAYVYPDGTTELPWRPPPGFAILQTVGAATIIAAIGFAASILFTAKVPLPIRRLGMVGTLTSAVTIAAFLLSRMPLDIWSARYLQAIIWAAPFTLAPLAWLLGTRPFTLIMAPYLLSAALCGWLGFGLYVDGFRPIRLTSQRQQEHDLGQYLRNHAVHIAVANYWTSYHLTYLFHEDPVVIPIEGTVDRYPPYRQLYRQSAVVVGIFPDWPRYRLPEEFEHYYILNNIPYEKTHVPGFTLLTVHKQPTATGA